MNNVLSDIVDWITNLPAASLCFVFVYSLGIMLNKCIISNRSDKIPYIIVLTSAIGYSLLGEFDSRITVVRSLMDGTVIGIAAWLLHYYQDKIPVLKNIFPDSTETVLKKAKYIPK